MRLRLLLILSLLCAAQNVVAQLMRPDDFFHNGALSYLSNNIPHALEVVTNGLKFYPDDPKLKKLEELLKQQNQQQQQQQNQQQQNQSKSDQQKNDKDQKQDEQQAQNQSKSDQEKKDEKKGEQQQAKKSDEKKPEEPQGQAAAAGEMTPQEAKQLLDAQKNDEMLMPVSRKEKRPDQRRVLKDW